MKESTIDIAIAYYMHIVSTFDIPEYRLTKNEYLQQHRETPRILRRLQSEGYILRRKDLCELEPIPHLPPINAEKICNGH